MWRCMLDPLAHGLYIGLVFFYRSEFWRSSAASVPVRLQSDAIITTVNLAASRLHQRLALLHYASTNRATRSDCNHYNDVIISTKASQITSITSGCSPGGSGADQRKHQSSASLPILRGIPQRASDAENVSIWWRYHDTDLFRLIAALPSAEQ